MGERDDTSAQDAVHELARRARSSTHGTWTPELRALAAKGTWLIAHLGRDSAAPVRVKRLGLVRSNVDTVLVLVENESEPRYIARSRIEGECDE